MRQCGYDTDTKVKEGAAASSSVAFLCLPGRTWQDTSLEQIAYIQSFGKSPTIIFCNGFRSVMSGKKASELERHCRSKRQAFIRFDYRGMGLSSGNLDRIVFGDWVADTLMVIDSLAKQEKVIIVGSSMGGWIALHAAMQRKDQVVGVVGVAAAPDFIQFYELGMTDEQRTEYKSTGCMNIFSEYSEVPYTVSKQFVRESREWNILQDENPRISVACPVRLLHGRKDSTIPWQRIVALSHALPASLVEFILVEDGDHRLSKDEDIALLLSIVDDLVRISG